MALVLELSQTRLGGFGEGTCIVSPIIDQSQALVLTEI
jgi:hypothetical protein